MGERDEDGLHVHFPPQHQKNPTWPTFREKPTKEDACTAKGKERGKKQLGFAVGVGYAYVTQGQKALTVLLITVVYMNLNNKTSIIACTIVIQLTRTMLFNHVKSTIIHTNQVTIQNQYTIRKEGQTDRTYFLVSKKGSAQLTKWTLKYTSKNSSCSLTTHTPTQ